MTLEKHHRKKHEYFWVTELGIIIALAEGAGTANLLRKTKKYYHEDTDLQFMIETSFVFGTGTYKATYLTFLNKRKLEPNDIATIMATQIMAMQKELTPEKRERLIGILERYPEQHQQLIDITNQIQEKLDKAKHELTWQPTTNNTPPN